MNPVRKVYLNGEFLTPERAAVSVFDRGFMLGDGVYEVIPVFGGRLFRLAHHLDRLNASLDAIRIRRPLTEREWQAVFQQLLDPEGGDQSIYLQVTRGVAPRDHAFPGPRVAPTVFAYAQPLKYSAAADVAAGVAAVTVPDIRWSQCNIKAITLLPNVLMRQEAIDCGAVEAILLRDGLMTEGAASNIFIVRNGVLVTPPKGPFILPGITRDLVLELARAHRVPCAEEPVSETDLRTAEEVWMTSSMREILSITRLDGRSVGTGRPGAVHARVFALYKDYKQAFCAGRVD